MGMADQPVEQLEVLVFLLLTPHGDGCLAAVAPPEGEVALLAPYEDAC